MTAKEVFAADWLSLREPADHAARSDSLAALLRQFLTDRVTLKIVDLGAGLGSNLRWLGPRLPLAQQWLLVDHDPDLLQRALVRSRADPPQEHLTVTSRQADLAAGSFDFLADCELVTASALLDLVSAQWLNDLAQACQAQGCAVLFALTVNGHWHMIDTNGCDIGTDDDFFVRDAFNQHQRRDKGLGDALGPAAVQALPATFGACGYAVTSCASDWVLPAGHAHTRRLGPALVAGWRKAALEANPEGAARIEDWHGQRLSQLLNGRLGLEVGHLDFLALPKR